MGWEYEYGLWFKNKAKNTLDLWHIEETKCKAEASVCRIPRFKHEYLRISLRAKTLGLIFHDHWIDMYYELKEKK